MKRYPTKIIICKIYNEQRKFIFINNKKIVYARWLFEKEVRPLRPGEIDV